MKTLEEFYNEVLRSDALKQEFLKVIKDKGDLEDFLKENGCPVTTDELQEFMESKQHEDRELTEDELASIAGGTKSASLHSAANLGLDCDWDEIF